MNNPSQNDELTSGDAEVDSIVDLEKQMRDQKIAFETAIKKLEIENHQLRQLLDSRSNSLFAKLIDRLNPKKRKFNESLARDISIVNDSGMFDEEFYLANYPELASDFKSQQDPLKHYLKVGAFEGRNPSEKFASQWYIDCNPDVKAEGVNPLIHYILHGRDEGRAPIKEQLNKSGKLNTPEFYERKMWNGFFEQGFKNLEKIARIANKKQRAKALWYMSRWHFAHGDVEQALTNLEEMSSLQGKITKRFVVAKSKCLAVLERAGETKDVLAEPGAVESAGKMLPYLVANASIDSEVDRLVAINEIFSRSGLLPITKKDPNKPLELDNLAWDESTRGGVLEDVPKVSIVIPAYNAGETINIALDSLVTQTWQNLEIIVVNDCSSDNTEEVVAKYQARFDFIKLINNEVNMGAYPTRNRGVEAATGRFITIHDSDDWSHPQKIEFQANALLRDDKKVCTLTEWVRVKEDLRFVGSWHLNEVFVEKNHSSTMVKREVIEKYGLWDPVNVGGDTEFLWRIEKNFGADSIQTILDNVPMSFALALDSSLTRTKASHVKTIHYGLRRIYRESARWWHQQHGECALSAESSAFPIPLGNKRNMPSDYEVLLLADFSEENPDIQSVLEELSRLNREANGSVVLFHWPNYRIWHGAKLSDEVLKFCNEFNINFTHFGNEISARKVILQNAALWEYIPDGLPKVTSIQEVEIFKKSQSEATTEFKERLAGLLSQPD